MLLSPAKLTTATVGGNFVDSDNNSIQLDESDLEILKPNGLINSVKIKGSIVYQDGYVPPEPKPKSNRGRKPKHEKKKEKPFGTQFEFEVRIEKKIAEELKIKEKTYNVKVFLNGPFTITGVLTPYFDDIKQVVNEIAALIEDAHAYEKVEAVNFRSEMQNYQTSILIPKLKIDFVKFRNFLINYRQDISEKMSILQNLYLSNFPESYINEIEKFLSLNRMNISDIELDPQNFRGIRIIFERPRPGYDYNCIKIKKKKAMNEKITVKILNKKTEADFYKIDIKGGKRIIEIREIYLWFNHIFETYLDHFKFVPIEDSESDTDD
jgi:hypothetical protein